MLLCSTVAQGKGQAVSLPPSHFTPSFLQADSDLGLDFGQRIPGPGTQRNRQGWELLILLRKEVRPQRVQGQNHIW